MVYTATAATPNQLVDAIVPGIQWPFTDKQAAVVEQLVKLGKTTAPELLEEIRIGYDFDTFSRQHIWKTLSGGERNLIDYGKVEKHEGAGTYGADVFEWIDNRPVSFAGIADLGSRLPVNDRV